jgi:hypothetical protein
MKNVHTRIHYYTPVSTWPLLGKVLFASDYKLIYLFFPGRFTHHSKNPARISHF